MQAGKRLIAFALYTQYKVCLFGRNMLYAARCGQWESAALSAIFLHVILLLRRRTVLDDEVDYYLLLNSLEGCFKVSNRTNNWLWK